jgi:ankyrin repeat protein/beta-lactamase regulating signal transducer with metallopeptidase domain
MELYLTELTRYLAAQSWQIALLTVVVAVITFVLRRRTAHLRYLLWLMVLVKCLVPPLYAIPLRVLPPSAQGGKLNPMTQADRAVDSSPDTEATASEASAAHVQGRARPTQRSQIDENQLSAGAWLGIIWSIGAVAYTMMNLLRAARGHHWLRKTRQSLPTTVKAEASRMLSAYGIRKPPKIWMVEGVGQPFVWGVLRGDIYVPPGFFAVENREHRRCILAHEMSHVLRLDSSVNLLQCLAQALFWFHPFVWWANKEISREREKSCDEMVVARFGAPAKDYCSAMVEQLALRNSTRPVPSLAVAGPVKNIEERVKTMLRPGKEFYKQPSLMSATTILLAAVVTVPGALVLTARGEENGSTGKQRSAGTSARSAEERWLEGITEYLDRNALEADDWRDTWGHTFLHRACLEGYRQAAEFLIDKGADVNADNITGITPLHTAAGRGHADVVALLLDKQADVNAKDRYGATPLWYARNGVVYSFDVHGRFWKGVTDRWKPEKPGCKKAAGLLVERGAIDQAPVLSLHEAANYGRVARVRSLLAEGADVNAMDDRLAGTPLHLAAYSNQKKMAEFLISRGADVNARNKWDRTPLHIALDQGHTEIAELLRQNGARLEPATEAARVRTATSLFESAKSKYPIPEDNLDIPEQMQACAGNLQKIHAAIKEYEKDKGQLPVWLSDLVPDYAREEVLMCPNNPDKQVPWPKDPYLPCGYAYEFCPFRGYAKFGGSPHDGMTQRDRKMAQVAFFGDVVPVCRCRLHGPRWLNISVGGEVYVSGPQWESTIIPDYKVGSALSERARR